MKTALTIATGLLLFLFLTPSATPQHFGKNSVQYTNFDWHFIQSQHFDIYYYGGGETAATFVADVAEGARSKISQSWEYELRDRIVIVLYNSHNDFQQTNLNVGPPGESVGGFTEFYKNRIVIPFEGSYEQLRHVTHHELTHAMLLQMLFGTGTFSIISGISKANIPLWFIEGLAEYESRDGWDCESDMFIRDAVISGYLPPIPYLSGFMAYKGGQSVLAFIAERYGRQKIGELLVKVRIYKDIDKALLMSVGTGIEQLTTDWHKYLRKKYWPEYPERAEPGDFARQLTFHRQERNFINNSGSLSPDGAKMVYLSDRSGYFDIYLASALDGAPLAKLVSGQKSGRLEELHWLRPGITWSPDGRKIAFAAKDRAYDVLHIVDISSRDMVQSLKFDLDAIYSPDWSPDGKQIAFAGTRAGRSDIYIADLSSGALQPLTSDIFSDLEPAWSPDGTSLIFVSDRTTHLNANTLSADFKIQDEDYHRSDIYMVDVSTRRIVRLTDTRANERTPIWSPDGSSIAYVSDANGIFNIYLKNLSGKSFADELVLVSRTNLNHLDSTVAKHDPVRLDNAYPITNVLTGIDHLSWEGQRLIFTSFHEGGFDIYGMTQPAAVTPDAVHLLPTRHVIETLTKASDSAQNTAGPVVRDSSGNEAYRDFIFGEEFREGRPVSASSVKEGVFLDPQAVRTLDGSFKSREYRTKFSADIITAGAGYDPFFGFQGATLLSFSDLMGNHRINLLTDVFVDYKNSDFAVSYQYRPRQTDYSAGVYQKNYLFFSGGRFLVRDRNFGMQLQMNRPFDRYRRLSYGIDLKFIRRQGIADLQDGEEKRADSSTKVGLLSVAYVKDNVIWGYTGPRAGARYNLSIQASPDLGSNGLDFRIYQFDYRTYLNFARNYTYAIRLSGGFSEGRNRQRFFLGGMPNWMNLRFRKDITFDLQDVYFSNFVTPMRGFDYYEQVGHKYFLMNMELRIPFVDYVQTRWPVPLRFANIRGSVFLDAGTAWDRNLNLFTRTPGGQIRLDDLLMSFGLGARVNLGIFLLKYDIAWRTDFYGVSRSRSLISVGADF